MFILVKPNTKVNLCCHTALSSKRREAATYYSQIPKYFLIFVITGQKTDTRVRNKTYSGIWGTDLVKLTHSVW